jgi:hypothetical protein
MQIEAQKEKAATIYQVFASSDLFDWGNLERVLLDVVRVTVLKARTTNCCHSDANQHNECRNEEFEQRQANRSWLLFD